MCLLFVVIISSRISLLVPPEDPTTNSAMSSIVEPSTVALAEYESSFTSESSPIGVECDRVCSEKKKKEKK